MRAKYPSDISPEQFEPIRALLESARKSTRPRSEVAPEKWSS